MSLLDYRERRAFEEFERAERRRANLAEQSATVNSAELRIRAWEKAHQLRMPADPCIQCWTRSRPRRDSHWQRCKKSNGGVLHRAFRSRSDSPPEPSSTSLHCAVNRWQARASRSRSGSRLDIPVPAVRATFIPGDRRRLLYAAPRRSSQPPIPADLRCAFSYSHGAFVNHAGDTTVTPSIRLAFIGNSLPRRCGIATFTNDLQHAVALSRPSAEAVIVAMNDRGQSYDYPPVVRVQINDEKLKDYTRAAEVLNAGQFDAVSLQHEFGIFGGDAGANVLTLLSRLNMPVVTTLHTVLSDPKPIQRRVLSDIVGISSKVVVMAEKAKELLVSAYDVRARKIEVIPHGIPDVPYVPPEAAKLRLGFDGRPVILTFGLLSPNKGIEVMIDAMPAVLRAAPAAVYVVLGATHPNLVRSQGEAYRESLVARARARGVENHVLFLDRFVDLATLLDFISMCDVYVTPYLNESQMTSGTLAYSYGLGKAVVSTPYWHARELLSGGRGVLVPFNDVATIGAEVAGLLTDHARRETMRERAYAGSRAMTWARTAERYMSLFESVRVATRPPVRAVPSRQLAPRAQRPSPRDSTRPSSSHVR